MHVGAAAKRQTLNPPAPQHGAVWNGCWLDGLRIKCARLEGAKDLLLRHARALGAPPGFARYVRGEVRGDNSMFLHVYVSDVDSTATLATAALDVYIKAWDGLYDSFSAVRLGLASGDAATFAPDVLAWATALLLRVSGILGLPGRRDMLALFHELRVIPGAEAGLAVGGWPGPDGMEQHYFRVTGAARLWLRRLGLVAEAWRRTALALLVNNLADALRCAAGPYNVLAEAPPGEVAVLARRLVYGEGDERAARLAAWLARGLGSARRRRGCR